MQREKRKNDHLRYAVELDSILDNGLKDINLIPDALPDLDLQEIEISTTLGDFELPFPLIINAITGGTNDAQKVNLSLARAAKYYNLPMAVGSQTAALNKEELKESFQIVRKINPNGLIFANLGAHVSLEQAQQAVEMLEANALQIHLNVPQELAMAEGDRDFRGYWQNISLIHQKINIPVIVKEVGFGLARETVKRIKEIGIRLIDIGGKGGTNFIAIEKARQKKSLQKETFLDWGLSTAVSTVEAVTELGSQGDIIASGGLTNGLELAKVIAMGAQAGAIAGPFLRTLVLNGEQALFKEIGEIENQLKMTMLMIGAKSIPLLQEKPLVISGKTAHWLTQRNIDITKYARR